MEANEAVLQYMTDAETGVRGLKLTGEKLFLEPYNTPVPFTPFHRAANAIEQAVQSTGLGLAIVADIVADHGGTVNVGSQVGEGSTFTVTLAAAAAGADAADEVAIAEPVP